jgi:hypothetical protein
MCIVGLYSSRYSLWLIHFGLSRFFVRMISSASQACIIFHDTFPLAYRGQLLSFPLRHPLRWYVEYYESSVNRHFQSDHFRPSLRHTFTAMCRVGEVDPVVQSREVIVGLRQTVRSAKYARRVSPSLQRAVRPPRMT